VLFEAGAEIFYVVEARFFGDLTDGIAAVSEQPFRVIYTKLRYVAYRRFSERRREYAPEIDLAEIRRRRDPRDRQRRVGKIVFYIFERPSKLAAVKLVVLHQGVYLRQKLRKLCRRAVTVPRFPLRPYLEYLKKNGVRALYIRILKDLKIFKIRVKHVEMDSDNPLTVRSLAVIRVRGDKQNVAVGYGIFSSTATKLRAARQPVRQNAYISRYRMVPFFLFSPKLKNVRYAKSHRIFKKHFSASKSIENQTFIAVFWVD